MEPDAIRSYQLCLKTRRLVLHDLSLDDAPALYEYRSDPRVAEFQSFHPRSLSDAVQFIAASSIDQKPGDHWFQLGMYLENRLIGDLGIHYPESGTDICELGYTVSPPFQRAGFGKEAVAAVIGHLFSRRGMRRILACLDSRNMASMALLARLNFNRIPLYPREENSLTPDAREVFPCGPDEILLELHRSDWT